MPPAQGALDTSSSERVFTPLLGPPCCPQGCSKDRDKQLLPCGTTSHSCVCPGTLTVHWGQTGNPGADLPGGCVPRDGRLSPSRGCVPLGRAGPPPQGAGGGLEGDAGRVVLLLGDDFFTSGALEARAARTDLGPAAGALVLARWVADSWGDTGRWLAGHGAPGSKGYSNLCATFLLYSVLGSDLHGPPASPPCQLSPPQPILESPCPNSSAVTGTSSSLTSCPNHSPSPRVFLITAHQLQFAPREESAVNYMLDPDTSQVNRCQIGFITQSARAREAQLTWVGPG